MTRMLKSALKSAAQLLSKNFTKNWETVDATQKEKLIVLTTGRLDSWKLESPRVDAITSASVMTQAATIGQSLAGKALKIIRSQQNI